jgi:hypothetical protein
MRSALSLADFFPIADALHGRIIVDAYGLCEAGSRGYEAVHLILDKGWCRIDVDIDFDELHVLVEANSAKHAPSSDARLVADRTPLSALVGKEIGWSWTCYNSQGYRDTILMGVPGIAPRVIFHSIASAILIGVTSLEAT